MELTHKTFTNITPTGEDQLQVLQEITNTFVDAWLDLDKVLPPGPNKTLVYRSLEDACFRAKKAVLLEPFNEGQKKIF